MRLTEVVALAWTQVDMAAMIVRIDDTKRGEPLEFPVTRQLAAIQERWLTEQEQFPGEVQPWVFPSETSASGPLESIPHLYARIGEAGGWSTMPRPKTSRGLRRRLDHRKVARRRPTHSRQDQRAHSWNPSAA